MSVWNVKRKWFVSGVLLMTFAAGAAQAQTTRRRETSANRRARIERTIQDTYSHRWEVGGGGGYLRWRSGEQLRKNNEVSFWLGPTYYFNPKLGVMGEIRGNYGHAQIGNTIYNIPNPQISEYTFMGGPVYRVYAKEQVGISVFGEGGAAVGKFDSGSKGIPAVDIGLWPSATRGAFSVGLNFDYNFYPNLALRVTPNYLGTTFGGTIQNNVGFNFGVVYRFGRITR